MTTFASRAQGSCHERSSHKDLRSCSLALPPQGPSVPCAVPPRACSLCHASTPLFLRSRDNRSVPVLPCPSSLLSSPPALSSSARVSSCWGPRTTSTRAAASSPPHTPPARPWGTCPWTHAVRGGVGREGGREGGRDSSTMFTMEVLFRHPSCLAPLSLPLSDALPLLFLSDSDC